MASNCDVSSAAWYLNKARECEQLAKDATRPEERVRYENEARSWREIATDIAKRPP